MTTADRIKLLRKTLGITQKDFAKKLGITQASLSLIESGTSSLTKQNIKLICMNFGISEEWLVDGVGERYSSTTILTDYETRLLSIFRQLSIVAQKMLIEYAEKLVSDEQSMFSMAENGHIKTEDAPTSNLEISTLPPWEQEESDGDGKDSLSS